MNHSNRAKTTKLGHVRVLMMDLSEVHPSPENDQLYRPVDRTDPDFINLVESIRQHGVLQPILVTLDGDIISGHRRYAAAKAAGLTRVPCSVEPIRRSDDPDAFVRLLAEHNQCREKSFDEKLREAVVRTNPEAAYESLIEHRIRQRQVKVSGLKIWGNKKRFRISKAKREFLNAVLDVIDANCDFWPLSVRQVHYQLLNDPPLMHARKSESRYANDQRCYKSLTELVTRARLAGEIESTAISDDTRPVATWDVYRDVASYFRLRFGNLFRGYYRDLQQSQPNHIEIVAEKNTVKSIVEGVAQDYCIPVTISRGYCSLPPRQGMVDRFMRSGKGKLVVLIVSDFDPDGEEIAQSLARSLRDDFGVDELFPIKVALKQEHVRKFRLTPMMKAKKSSVHHARFVKEHGEDVFELEALQPSQLQELLRDACESVMDMELFNAERDREREDATALAAKHKVLRGMVLGSGMEVDDHDD